MRAGTWPEQKPEMMIAGRSVYCFYCIVDGIYASFTIFLETIAQPKTKKEKFYAKSQEAFRKAVDRLFGAHFSRWPIIAHPSKPWHTVVMNETVKACAIRHNMIVEFRDKDGVMGTKNIISFDPDAEIVPIRTSSLPLNNYDASDCFRVVAESVEDERHHAVLQNASADATWMRQGTEDQPLSDISS